MQLIGELLQCLNVILLSRFLGLIKFFTLANDFLAMDGPAALTVPPEPPHHTDGEPAPKETRTSKPIITYSHHQLSDL